MKTVALLALFFLLAPPSYGQAAPKAAKNSPASSYKLIALKATGTERYTDEEMLAASGLQLGQNVGEEDFKGAVQRLGESGLFADVGYSYSYSSAGTKVEFQLTDTPEKNLVPAHFENIVWFKDAELLGELQKRVPLFKQMLPVSGALPDRVSEALQSMLQDKHLPGHVDYLRQGKQQGGDLTGIAYRVTDVDIRIRDLEFPGATPEQVALLKMAAHQLAGAEYDRDALSAVARLDLLPVYLQRGYLKAEFAQADAHVVEPPPANDEVQVDAILPVTPGKVYSTSDVAWKGNSAISTAQMQSLIHLPAGQPADEMRLQRDLEQILKLYRNQGYMMAHITPTPALDDEKSTVHYDLSVVEGDQFKMGELEIVGLDAQETPRMQEAWTLVEGQPYNASYPAQFLEKNFRKMNGRVRWKASVNESVNVKDKTVDVTIKCTAE
jgi:outer membrane protein assembly factor BamA